MQLSIVAFIIVMVILAIAAAKTAIPNAQESKTCFLGYRATCPFTPISTLILIAADIVVFIVAKRLAVF